MKSTQPERNAEIVPKARGSIHHVVLDWFSAQKRGTVLDAPAGYGHLSMHLKNMGFHVTSGEIEPEIFRAKGLKCIYTDLNRRIESTDNYFDYVCCIDGLEHMTDPYTAAAEFARVLKPGGYGVFSIPNYSNIEKRFKYFLNGYLTKPKTIDDYRKANSNLFNFHNSPLTITLIDFLFGINGLNIELILRDKVKKKQYLFFPVVSLLKFKSFLSSAGTKKKHRTDITLRNEVVFGGNTLIFIVKKRDHS